MKIANFTGKLLQSYKQLKCKIFWILLKRISDHLSVLLLQNKGKMCEINILQSLLQALLYLAIRENHQICVYSVKSHTKARIVVLPLTYEVNVFFFVFKKFLSRQRFIFEN